MAAFDASEWIGTRAIRPTDAQLEKIANYDPGLYGVGLSALLQHLHYLVIALQVHTAANGNSKTSVGMSPRVPLKIVAMDVGCEVAAATSATADVEKKPSGGAFATMSTGAVDIKTGAGTLQNLPVLDGAEDVETTDTLQLKITSGSAADVTGGVGYLHAFRR